MHVQEDASAEEVKVQEETAAPQLAKGWTYWSVVRRMISILYSTIRWFERADQRAWDSVKAKGFLKFMGDL